MNDRQRHRWERTRRLGQARFVLLYGVLLCGCSWAFIALLVVQGLTWLIEGSLEAVSYWQCFRFTLPGGLFAGLVFGFTIWTLSEQDVVQNPALKNRGWADPVRHVVWP